MIHSHKRLIIKSRTAHIKTSNTKPNHTKPKVPIHRSSVTFRCNRPMTLPGFDQSSDDYLWDRVKWLHQYKGGWICLNEKTSSWKGFTWLMRIVSQKRQSPDKIYDTMIQVIDTFHKRMETWECNISVKLKLLQLKLNQNPFLFIHFFLVFLLTFVYSFYIKHIHTSNRVVCGEVG